MMTKKKVMKRIDKQEFVSCKFCSGNIDLLSSDYIHFLEHHDGKLVNESLFHKNCWEGRYKQDVTKTAQELVNNQLKGQMEMLKNIMTPPA